MTEHPVVGPLFSAHILERSVLATLRDYLPPYLTIACELNGITEGIAKVESWGLESELADDWPSQGMPALLVVSGSTTDEPEEGGDGMIRAEWRCDVIISVKAATGPRARRYAQVYGAAIRGALLQRRTLGEELQVARWLGEDTGGTVRDIEDTESSVCSVMNSFGVERERVVSWQKGAGSLKPIPDGWPEVKEIDVKTEVKE
jgi:hypothetical protein